MKRTLMACVAAAAIFSACDRTVTYTEETAAPATCFNCHSDQDTRLVAAEQQYFFSVHASGTAVSEPDDPCSGCHTSEGFVQRIETGTIPTGLENPTAINCFTCHAPHTNGDLSRRVEDPFPLATGVAYDLRGGNICSACHQSRRDVETYITPRIRLTTRFGPHHSPQADMLVGTNGYEYPGFTYEQTNHLTATEDACLDCHYKVTENLRVGGHSFNMTYSEDGEDMMNTGACAACHGDLDDFDLDGYQTQTDSLVTELRTRLVAAGLVDDASGNPVQMPSGTTTSADSAGAVWNYMCVIEDRSRGVHNRKYMQSLLESGIAFMDGALAPAPLATRAAENGGGSK
jgi:hypothetical protein